jgi:hypothetical protein
MVVLLKFCRGIQNKWVSKYIERQRKHVCQLTYLVHSSHTSTTRHGKHSIHFPILSFDTNKADKPNSEQAYKFERIQIFTPRRWRPNLLHSCFWKQILKHVLSKETIENAVGLDWTANWPCDWIHELESSDCTRCFCESMSFVPISIKIAITTLYKLQTIVNLIHFSIMSLAEGISQFDEGVSYLCLCTLHSPFIHHVADITWQPESCTLQVCPIVLMVIHCYDS